jgi:hypothetical protein
MRSETAVTKQGAARELAESLVVLGLAGSFFGALLGMVVIATSVLGR